MGGPRYISFRRMGRGIGIRYGHEQCCCTSFDVGTRESKTWSTYPYMSAYTYQWSTYPLYVVLYLPMEYIPTICGTRYLICGTRYLILSDSRLKTQNS